MGVPANVKRRLERLELSLAIGRPIGLWPPMLSCNEWEAIALPMQTALQTDANNDQALARYFNIG